MANCYLQIEQLKSCNYQMHFSVIANADFEFKSSLIQVIVVIIAETLAS